MMIRLRVVGIRASAAMPRRKNVVDPSAELSTMIRVICMVNGSSIHSPWWYASITWVKGFLRATASTPMSRVSITPAVIASGTRCAMNRANLSIRCCFIGSGHYTD